MTAPKGYVVRGTHRRGWPVFAYDHSGAFGGPSETDIPLHVFPSLDTASGARAHMVRCGCTDVAIFRVHDDGREERLSSYEEALQRSQDVASILTDGVPAIMRSSAPATREQIGAAACQMLKAIERALSVLRGSEAPLATLDIERRRLAAKGGA